MNLEREIDRRIEKKQVEIEDLEKRLGEAKAYLSALEDTAKLFPKTGDKAPTLRPGTDIARARDLIKSKGNPLHIVDLLKGLNKEVNKSNKISLSGSLSGYVRKGIVFSKPAPNTFGLIELENSDSSKLDELLPDPDDVFATPEA